MELANISQLRASSQSTEFEASTDPKGELRQIHTIKKAYELLTSEEPWLPARDSILPALLALRTTDRCINESSEGVVEAQKNLQDISKILEREKSDLADAKMIQSEMQTRTLSLQDIMTDRTQKTSSQIAKDMMKDIKKKKAYYDGETGKLVKAYNDFIDEHLAPMLAVEELGGPIVGNSIDVDDDMLEGTFNAQGKLKKIKPKEDKRQQRIDQIWGSRPEQDDAEEPRNERFAAAAEMRYLTECLLNSLVQAQGTGPGAYIKLKRESAAARFLVRSKVAQFHPNDATRLRLLDFGGEIDD